MNIGNMAAILAAVSLLASCGNRQSDSSAEVTESDIEPVVISIYRVIPASVPTMTSDHKASMTDKQISMLHLPDEADWTWIRSTFSHNDTMPLWDLIAYDRTPLLVDTITDIKEDLSIDSYPQLTWRFHDPTRFAEITRNNIGRPLALAINGHIVMAPTVNCEIESGNCAVGPFTLADLDSMRHTPRITDSYD